MCICLNTTIQSYGLTHCLNFCFSKPRGQKKDLVLFHQFKSNRAEKITTTALAMLISTHGTLWQFVIIKNRGNLMSQDFY
jgi:hypothetical protein